MRKTRTVARPTRSAYQKRSIHGKVALPPLPSRVKKRDQLSSHWIAAGDVGAFVLIAVQAAPGEVLKHGSATMLLGDDVIDLEREGIVRGWHVAILARAGSTSSMRECTPLSTPVKQYG